jgi:hypothetical protein
VQSVCAGELPDYIPVVDFQGGSTKYGGTVHH